VQNAANLSITTDAGEPTLPSCRATLFIAVFVSFILPLHSLAGPLEQGFRAYEQGDYHTAMQIWQPLANSNPDAAFNLGLLYKNGLGVKKAPREAMKWFKLAAQQGSADAAYNLGVLYISGEAGYPSKKDAVYWWKQAAEYGHHESQYNYGVMLAYGNGVKRNVTDALDWWKLSAQQGDENAIRALVQTYEQGLPGVAKDPKKAGYWKKQLP